MVKIYKYLSGWIHIAIGIPIIWLVFIMIGTVTSQSVFQSLENNSFSYIICYTLIITVINIIKINVSKIRRKQTIKQLKAILKNSNMKIKVVDGKDYE